MSRLMRSLFVAFGLLAGLAFPGRCETAAPALVTARGAEILAPDGTPLKLRGIGLGNWLVPEGYMFGFETARAPREIAQLFREMAGPEFANAFWRTWRDSFIVEADLDWLAHSGVNLVRIPFDYRLWTPEENPGLWIDDGFALLDRIVAWAGRHGIYVMLDMHAAPCGQTGSNIDNSDGVAHLYTDEVCVRRTGDVWEKIARHYAGNPTIAGYELLNEPAPLAQGDATPVQVMARITRDLIARIREGDAGHIIFDNSLMWKPDDPSPGPGIVSSFHLYWTEVTPQLLQPFLDFRARTNTPVVMSESGENTDAWVRAFREALEAHNIGWVFWPYKKLAVTSAMRSYAAPPFWDEIVAYQLLLDKPAKERLAERPPIEHARAALNGLLASIRFENTKVNADYVRSLGLVP